MNAVFKAVILAFLTAAVYLSLSVSYAYLDVYTLSNWDARFGQDGSFRLAITTKLLYASLLCVTVLFTTAFAKRYIDLASPAAIAVTAFSVSAPIMLLGLLSDWLDPKAAWSPFILLLFSAAWATVGLHYLLWRVTAKSGSDP